MVNAWYLVPLTGGICAVDHVTDLNPHRWLPKTFYFEFLGNPEIFLKFDCCLPRRKNLIAHAVLKQILSPCFIDWSVLPEVLFGYIVGLGLADSHEQVVLRLLTQICGFRVSQCQKLVLLFDPVATVWVGIGSEVELRCLGIHDNWVYFYLRMPNRWSVWIWSEPGWFGRLNLWFTINFLGLSLWADFDSHLDRVRRLCHGVWLIIWANGGLDVLLLIHLNFSFQDLLCGLFTHY